MKTNKMKPADIIDIDLHLWRAPSKTHTQKSVATALHHLNYAVLLIAKPVCQCAHCFQLQWKKKKSAVLSALIGNMFKCLIDPLIMEKKSRFELWKQSAETEKHYTETQRNVSVKRIIEIMIQPRSRQVSLSCTVMSCSSGSKSGGWGLPCFPHCIVTTLLVV